MNFQQDVVSGTKTWTKKVNSKGQWQANGEHIMKQETWQHGF